jgi:hypothetical protein
MIQQPEIKTVTNMHQHNIAIWVIITQGNYLGQVEMIPFPLNAWWVSTIKANFVGLPLMQKCSSGSWNFTTIRQICQSRTFVFNTVTQRWL